jgi:hypothetical protein
VESFSFRTPLSFKKIVKNFFLKQIIKKNGKPLQFMVFLISASTFCLLHYVVVVVVWFKLISYRYVLGENILIVFSDNHLSFCNSIN